MCAGAGEQRQKSEDVYCPVCRTPWDYIGPAAITSPPVTHPPDTVSGVKVSSPSHPALNEDKQALYNQLKAVSNKTNNCSVLYLFVLR